MAHTTKGRVCRKQTTQNSLKPFTNIQKTDNLLPNTRQRVKLKDNLVMIKEIFPLVATENENPPTATFGLTHL